MWVPLRLMFPEARIPIAEVSLPTRWAPRERYEVGQALRELRSKGVPVIRSGGIVHNLRLMNWREKDAAVDPWAPEFEQWVKERLERHELETLFQYEKMAPHARRAVRTPEHIAPLFPVVVAAGDSGRVVPIFEGMEHGKYVDVQLCDCGVMASMALHAGRRSKLRLYD